MAQKHEIDQSAASAVQRFEKARVLCVGDVMLDRYVYGRVDRMSPEAPIPILAVDGSEAMLGASGNVVRNVVAMGGEATLITIVGDDDAGREIARLIRETRGVEPVLITAPKRRTTVKVRYVAANQQMLRADHEDVSPLGEDKEDELVRAFADVVDETDVVLISDYAKGVFSDRVLTKIIELSRAAKKPIVADPKNDDVTRYKKVTVLKPNASEASRAVNAPCDTDQEAAIAAEALRQKVGANAVLITRSERGMTLVSRNKDKTSKTSHYRPEAVEVSDVSGAGDTSLAAFGLAIATNISFEQAASIANTAGSLVVAKVGTAVVHQHELISALQQQSLNDAEAKIAPPAVALDRIALWRAKGQTIGFTNGCFDLVHPGHVSLLAQARAESSRLVVGLNTDASVKRLKGPDRPINSEMARAVVLASLQSVDLVVLFDQDTPLELIKAFKPDILVKGADYTIDQVVGADLVHSYGGKVVLAELKQGHSTTGAIARLVKNEKSA
jgi:D-beta-D-heptose 7-phosphate kinase/D-beta-D-heptose 1-phosphate adenosyltransferase